MLARGYTYKGSLTSDLILDAKNKLIKVYYNSKTIDLVKSLEEDLVMIENYCVTKKCVSSNYFDDEIYLVVYDLVKINKDQQDNIYSLIDLALENYFLRRAYTEIDFTSLIERYLLIIKAYNLDCFKVMYQGIYGLKEKKIIGYEALLSIYYEDKVLKASDFIFELYDLNLSPVICKRVLNKVYADLAKLEGKVSINIRINDLLDKEMISLLEKYSKLGSKRIILEILEDDNFLESKKYISQVKYLKSLGYKMAIDDFGSKYANLSYLKLNVFNYLKISGTFNKLIGKDDILYQEIIKSIVNLAHLKGMKVLKENAESYEEVALYEKLKLDYVQGYIFAKPIRID